MNYFDLIIIIPLLWGAYKGYRKGFIIEIASLIALFLGVWGGVKFSNVTAQKLSSVFDISEKLMPLISFAVTFILIVVVIFFLAKMLQKVIKMVALGTINRIAGGLFGILKFSLIISVILTIVNGVNQKVKFIEDDAKETSILYEPISLIAPTIIPGMNNLSLDKLLTNEDANTN